MGQSQNMISPDTICHPEPVEGYYLDKEMNKKKLIYLS